MLAVLRIDSSAAAVITRASVCPTLVRAGEYRGDAKLLHSGQWSGCCCSGYILAKQVWIGVEGVEGDHSMGSGSPVVVELGNENVNVDTD